MNTYIYYTRDGLETNLDTCHYITVKLNASASALISKNDFPLISDFKWILGKDGYPVTYQSVDKSINFGRMGLKMHLALNPKLDKGYVIDHINRNKLDNRRDNMRICTIQQNNYNKSKSSNSKHNYKGVRQYKKNGKILWKAIVNKGNEKYVIDDIPDEKMAAKIYDAMAEEVFGEYAGKNFLDTY